MVRLRNPSQQRGRREVRVKEMTPIDSLRWRHLRAASPSAPAVCDTSPWKFPHPI